MPGGGPAAPPAARWYVPAGAAMAIEDRERWNARYGDEGAPAAPRAFLAGLDDVLPRSGRALDVAGGAGVNAVWLARRGLEVTIVDVSDVALRLAADAASEAGVPLAALRMDLEAEPLPEGPWDVIVCTYFLHRPLFDAFAGLLGVGGGTVLVPVLVLGQGLSQHTAQGVSLALIVPIGLVGAVSYARNGFSRTRLLPALLIGGAVGAWFGATLAHQLKGPVLSRLFALFLIAAAIHMIAGSRRSVTPAASPQAGGSS